MSSKMFNLRRISTEKLPQSFLSEGVVRILGRKEELNPYAHQVYAEVLRGVDYGSTFYHYDIVVEEGHDDLADYFECNIICLLPNRLNGTAEAVVALALPDELGLAVVAVINEVESRTLDMAEAAIALCALGAPDVYHKAVNMAVDRLLHKSSHAAIAFKGKAGIAFGSPRGALFGSKGIITPKKPEVRPLSEKEIREVVENLPKHYSVNYEKRNPEVARIVKQTLSLIAQNGFPELMLEVAKTNKSYFLQSIFKVKNQLAAKYTLRLRKWSNATPFTDNYQYCLSLVDNTGKERFLRFKTTPAYCLYVMYVMDRYTRGEEATDLSFIENKAQFIDLYTKLFKEDRDTVASYCELMVHRKTKTGNWRAGRYDECIANINDTIDGLVGFPDSMVLKVGRGNFIAIPQSHIEIDRSLPIVKFV